MNDVSLALMHAQLANLANLAKWTLEGFLAAAFLTFCYLIAPYVRDGGSRRG